MTRWPIPRIEADPDLEDVVAKYEAMSRRMGGGGAPVFGALAKIVEQEQINRIDQGGHVRSGHLRDSVKGVGFVNGLVLEMAPYGRYIRRQDPGVVLQPSRGGTSWGRTVLDYFTGPPSSGGGGGGGVARSVNDFIRGAERGARRGAPPGM